MLELLTRHPKLQTSIPFPNGKPRSSSGERRPRGVTVFSGGADVKNAKTSQFRLDLT